MSAPVAPGELVAGKYRVDRVLGQGGMGVVVAAEHVELGQRVAIKFLLSEAMANAEAVARFEREGRAVVRLQSDHVARVLDVGRLPAGTPYMVIEFLEGEDLAQELARQGCLPIADAVRYVVQACDAIGEAHSVGIVHRDIKPANLFLARRRKRAPMVKVLDFGISKSTSALDSTSALTSTSAMMGSPLYMSPEQLRAARDIDARTDIWSLGATLYELLAGTTPFTATTVAELCAHILTAPVPPIASRLGRHDVPPGLEAVVLRCLEKDPAARFANVDELVLALTPFAELPDAPGRSSSVSARPPGDAPVPTRTLAMTPSAARSSPSGSPQVWGQGTVSPLQISSREPLPAPVPSRRALALAGVALTVCVLVSGGWLLSRLGSSPNTAAIDGSPSSSVAAEVAPSAETPVPAPPPSLVPTPEPLSPLSHVAATTPPLATSVKGPRTPAIPLAAASVARYAASPAEAPPTSPPASSQTAAAPKPTTRPPPAASLGAPKRNPLEIGLQ